MSALSDEQRLCVYLTINVFAPGNPHLPPPTPSPPPRPTTPHPVLFFPHQAVFPRIPGAPLVRSFALFSPIPYFRSFTSESAPTPLSSSTPTSSESALASTVVTSYLITSSPSLFTTTAPPSPSSSPSSPTPHTSLSSALSTSSGLVLSTFTSFFVSEIDGSPTTASVSLRPPSPLYSLLLLFFLARHLSKKRFAGEIGLAPRSHLHSYYVSEQHQLIILLSQIVTPIVTALRTSGPSSRSSARTSIIAGSAVAGLVLLILALATLFFFRKRTRRQRYWALTRAKRNPSRSTFLVGEEMDLPSPSPPLATLDQPDPFTTYNAHRNSSAAGSFRSGAVGVSSDNAPVYIHPRFSRSQSDGSSHAHMHLPGPLSPPPSSPFLPPRLLRARASESGSIFQESVWPPPAALMDPLTSPSQSVNLARIVTDVMGPPDADPLLLLPPGSLRDRGQEQEQEQEQGVLEPKGEGEGEGERPSAMIPPSSPLALTNPDDLSPRSDLQSPPPPPPSTPPPLEREREPSTPSTPPPWLSRPLNPSPRSSPLLLQRSSPA